MRRTNLFIIIIAVLFVPMQLTAAELTAKQLTAKQLTAKQIIDKSYDHNMMDFNSATADLKMDYIETNQKDGKASQEVVETRKFRVKGIKIKSGEEELSRVLLTVTYPEDESGTAFLTIENAGDKDDDQWLYMSALKRSFRKGGKTGKNESFMGSEFTYGDMASKDINKAAHKRLPDENIGGIDCFVIESIPNDPKDEQHSKYITWVSKKTWIPRRVKFFDLKGQFKKILIAEKVEKIDGDDTITQAIMFNKQSGKATRIFISNINTKVKLTPEDFTRERMTKL